MRLGLLLLTCLLIAPAEVDRSESFDFRYDILPVLHRQGCGSAYCHGSATGRGGFKLSLFASDPAADHRVITGDLGGRRLDLRKPTNSLLLKKPSMQTKHGGGRRIREGDRAHTALADWIEDGAPFRKGPARELLSLKLVRQGDRLRAVATFRDAGGEFEKDVTDLTTFQSSDDRVVAVSESGEVTKRRSGETWLFGRYVSRSARLAVVQPFGTVESRRGTPSHSLDRSWHERLRELGLQPGSQATPRLLARRLYLDLVDRLPTPAELRTFQDMPANERVENTAGELVKTGEFATKFGRHLAEWMEIPLDPPARANPRTGMYAQQHQRLVDAVRGGNTLHEIAENLIAQDRSLLDRSSDPRDRAELTGRAFLGIRIGCARCHDSPVDKWERRHHMAFSALFASPRPDPSGGMRTGILFDPETGAAVTPDVLPVDPEFDAVTESAVKPDKGTDNRSHAETVARFVVRGGHGMFERNVANRTFAALMGRGLVEPLDDNRLSNPAVHESILDQLTEVAKTGDLRRLVVHIVTSQLYQADSVPRGEHDDADVRFFARREARTMPPVTFANAVERALSCRPGERLPESPLARQLALINSEFLFKAVRSSRRLEDIIAFAPDAETRLRDIFTLLLSRPPGAAEIAAFLPSIEKDRSGDAARDLAFALLAGREFGSIR